jgi:hypothetical protein
MLPPGLFWISNVKPCTMNMVASVTTIDCSRNHAINAPLMSPMPPPIARISATPPHCSIGVPCTKRTASTLDNDTTADADRSKPPLSTTMVCPIAASASVVLLEITEPTSYSPTGVADSDTHAIIIASSAPIAIINPR